MFITQDVPDHLILWSMSFLLILQEGYNSSSVGSFYPMSSLCNLVNYKWTILFLFFFLNYNVSLVWKSKQKFGRNKKNALVIWCRWKILIDKPNYYITNPYRRPKLQQLLNYNWDDNQSLKYGTLISLAIASQFN